MLATIHIGSKKFILPGYTVVPFNCSLEGSLKQDVVLVFFKFITHLRSSLLRLIE